MLLARRSGSTLFSVRSPGSPRSSHTDTKICSAANILPVQLIPPRSPPLRTLHDTEPNRQAKEPPSEALIHLRPLGIDWLEGRTRPVRARKPTRGGDLSTGLVDQLVDSADDRVEFVLRQRSAKRCELRRVRAYGTRLMIAPEPTSMSGILLTLPDRSASRAWSTARAAGFPYRVARSDRARAFEAAACLRGTKARSRGRPRSAPPW